MYHEELRRNKVVHTITVQPVTTYDLDALAGLFNAYRIFYKKSSDLDGARQFLRERLANKESVIFCAFQDDTMTGFVQLYPIFSLIRMTRYWLLNDLFVTERFRGQGISLLLIDRVKDWCIETNASGFMLETAKDNVAGNALYARTGLLLDTGHNFYSWDI